MTPNRVILHCAATPDSEYNLYPIGEVRRWHVEKNGWSDIGYHWYLSRDGLWHKGREENVVGAHTKGLNENSLGLCYEGTWLPTDAQIKAICRMYLELKDRHGIRYGDWDGHYQSSKDGKTCPGFSIDILRALFQMIDGDYHF